MSARARGSGKGFESGVTFRELGSESTKVSSGESNNDEKRQFVL